jgi:photosystem II stability/assembly factor-like uncharacterized protein
MKIRELFASAALACVVIACPAQAETKSAVDRPAIVSAKASKSLLIDMAVADKRIIAVGDRGHILFSDDTGVTWTQAKVPVSVMLTGVFFANNQEGWAVGHNGVILYSSDAGASWRLQHSGKQASDDKAGAPLLDVWFADNTNGFAVGAYGYFLVTHDGGASWSDNSAAIINPDGWHLNAISGLSDGSAVFIAGEKGTLFRSLDKGATWATVPAPFDGSFFGVSGMGNDAVLLYGLQGRLFRSTDMGASWQQVQTGVTSGLNAATRLANGSVIVAGNAGVILVAKDAGLNLISQTRDDRQSISALLPLPSGELLTAGEGGLKRLPAGK